MSSNFEPSAQESPQSENSSLPKLSLEGRAEAKGIVEAFERDLKGIAAIIAQNARARKIIEPHIQEAHATLRRCGLEVKKPSEFYQRADFKVGIGSILVGLAPTIASISKDVIESWGGKLGDYPVSFWIWMILIPFVIVCAGVFLVAWGWTTSPDAIH